MALKPLRKTSKDLSTDEAAWTTVIAAALGAMVVLSMTILLEPKVKSSIQWRASQAQTSAQSRVAESFLLVAGPGL